MKSKLEKEMSEKSDEIKNKLLEIKIKEETINKLTENYNHNESDHTNMINKFNEEILLSSQKINKLSEELKSKNSEIKNILEEKK